MDRRNIYESGGDALSKEQDRLNKFEYPFIVSTELIGEAVDGKKILDIGSGPNLSLGAWAEKKGAKYIALDIVEQFLHEHKNASRDAVRGTVEALPFADNSIDITHTRLVLMHLAEARKKEAIREVYRVTKERALFLEFDWGGFSGSQEVNDFRDIAAKAGELLGVDIFMGRKLKNEIISAVGGANLLKERKFEQESVLKNKELVLLGYSIQESAKKLNNPNLNLTLAKAIKTLELKIEENPNETFHLPTIFSVELAK